MKKTLTPEQLQRLSEPTTMPLEAPKLTPVNIKAVEPLPTQVVMDLNVIWEANLTMHNMKPVNYLFKGSFKECMDIIELFEQIKPKPPIGAIIMDRVVSPFTMTLKGPSIQFNISNKSGIRSTEIVFL